MMNRTPIIPIYEFEEINPDDLIDGIKTLKGHSGGGLILPPPGEGPDIWLNCAIKDIEQAAKSSDSRDIVRFSANAIMSARRALSCLVDWYLERDLVAKCKNPPTSADKKTDFLVKRHIIDDLAASVLERAIYVRQKVEHKYESPTLEMAQDFVELIRREIYAIRAESNPERTAWTFGSYENSSGFSRERDLYAEFYGWHDSSVVIQRFVEPLWIGIVLPQDSTHATIRRAFLKDFGVEDILEMLTVLKCNYSKLGSWSGPDSCELMAKAMNII